MKRGIRVIIENDIILFSKIISASKLIKGGAAILAEIVINQHNAMVGDKISIPLLMRSLRENVFS